MRCEITYFFQYHIFIYIIYFLKWAVGVNVANIYEFQVSSASVGKLPLGYLILSVIFTEIRCGNPAVI